jgi:uncharacterized protein (TIGR02271 family)
MAHKAPVHVEPRENGWAVVREGSERATSVHPTQYEAAEAGRELARREGTEFFLHAQDGRIREHRSYGEGSSGATSEGEGILDRAAGAAGTLAGGLADAVAGSAARDDARRDEERSGGTTGVESDEVASVSSSDDAEEAGDSTEARQDDAPSTPDEQYVGYEVYDQDGERIGRLDDLFVDEDDNPEYVGVWTDPSGARSILIPAEAITVADATRRMVVSRPKGLVEVGPSLTQGEELTPGLEKRVRQHYGLQDPPSVEGRAGYGAYYRGDTAQAAEGGPSGVTIPDAAPLTPRPEDVGRGRPEAGEELRVSRSEEELRVDTRERDAGAVRIKKRVRTDRERVVVPKKRVEATVERVPVVDGQTAGLEVGEDEIVVPIVEEEVIVEKRPVVKEVLRIRKEVVEEEVVVEEDVRREEIEVDDQTERQDA